MQAISINVIRKQQSPTEITFLSGTFNILHLPVWKNTGIIGSTCLHVDYLIKDQFRCKVTDINPIKTSLAFVST